MGKLLLTSSQVNILVSSVIIFSCTFALFLSGYVIQQRTLRDLRTAIRPRPRKSAAPQIYLPDHFKPSVEVLADGTVVQGESDAEKEHRQRDTTVIEVTPTEHHVNTEGVTKDKLAIIEQLKQQVAEKSWAVDNPDPMAKSRVPVSRAERRRMIKEEVQKLSKGNEYTYYQRRLW